MAVICSTEICFELEFNANFSVDMTLKKMNLINEVMNLNAVFKKIWYKSSKNTIFGLTTFD